MFKKVLASTIIFAICLNLSVLSVIAQAAGNNKITISNKISDSFESGKLNTKIWNKEFGMNYSNTIVNTYSIDGKNALRTELRKDDTDVAGSKRSEIALSPEKPLEEHWYTISVYLPKGGDEDYSVDKSSECLIQWHNVPDPGEEWTSPPLALLIKDGNYQLLREWDDDAITSNKQMSQKGNVTFTDLGSYENDKGKWVTWKFHVKWGWEKSQNPILEVYKDAQMVLDCNGLPNTTNDQKGVYLKVGIYKWDWKSNPTASTTEKRVVYYDNISIE